MAFAILIAIIGPKKVALVMDKPPSKPLFTAPHKQQVHILGQLLPKVLCIVLAKYTEFPGPLMNKIFQGILMSAGTSG
jgi:hypothetical protein